eukprot:1846368-Rhodomonas_salina.2
MVQTPCCLLRARDALSGTDKAYGATLTFCTAGGAFALALCTAVGGPSTDVLYGGSQRGAVQPDVCGTDHHHARVPRNLDHVQEGDALKWASYAVARL